MSPEIHEKKEFDKKSDIWALGCIVYEMCTNEFAFSGNSEEEIKKAVCNNDPPQLPDIYNEELKNLLRRFCLFSSYFLFINNKIKLLIEEYLIKKKKIDLQQMIYSFISFY